MQNGQTVNYVQNGQTVNYAHLKVKSIDESVLNQVGNHDKYNNTKFLIRECYQRNNIHNKLIIINFVF